MFSSKISSVFNASWCKTDCRAENSWIDMNTGKTIYSNTGCRNYPIQKKCCLTACALKTVLKHTTGRVTETFIHCECDVTAAHWQDEALSSSSWAVKVLTYRESSFLIDSAVWPGATRLTLLIAAHHHVLSKPPMSTLNNQCWRTWTA